jgi:hypothetical protein
MVLQVVSPSGRVGVVGYSTTDGATGVSGQARGASGATYGRRAGRLQDPGRHSQPLAAMRVDCIPSFSRQTTGGGLCMFKNQPASYRPP